jgi:hypothetical protein
MSLYPVRYQLDNAGSNGKTIMLFSLFARCGKLSNRSRPTVRVPRGQSFKAGISHPLLLLLLLLLL